MTGRHPILRLIAGVWCAALIALMATGTLTNARIGEMTSGPEHDIISAAIAISQINFGLSGRLAYHEVAKAIAGPLLDGKDAWDVADAKDDANLQNPAKVTDALKRGAAVTLKDINVPENRAGYLTDWCEDLGYAEFYDLAFRLFGINAFATHWLYVSVLSLGVLLFVSQFYRDDAAMGSLTLAVSALFLTAQSDIFSKFMPSLAANRFLSTLALIPLLHIVHAALRQDRFKVFELVALLSQIFLMVFAITLRSSAEWTLIASATLLGALLYLRRGRSLEGYARRSSMITLLRRMSRAPGVRRPALIAGLIVLVVVQVGAIRRHQFDARYYWDDNLPYHLLWHSAYVGLAIDSKWPEYKPYPDLPGGGDGVGFNYFAHYMDAQGKVHNSVRGDVPGWILARPYEDFIRGQYLNFLRHHIIYSTRLFFYDKPVGMVQDLYNSIRFAFSDKYLVLNAFIFVASAGLAALLLAAGSRSAGSTIGVSLLILVCSSTPIMWAYPISFAMADTNWALLFVAGMIIALSVSKTYSGTREALGWRLT